MVGKNITGKNYIDLANGMLKGLIQGGIITEDYKSRVVACSEDDRFIVDTVYSHDTGFYETGIISHIYRDSWIIVDTYKTKKEAEERHKKWVEYMKTNPKKLIDIFGAGTYEKQNR